MQARKSCTTKGLRKPSLNNHGASAVCSELRRTAGFFSDMVILSDDDSGELQAQWCCNSCNQNNPNNCCLWPRCDSLVRQYASGSGEYFDPRLKRALPKGKSVGGQGWDGKAQNTGHQVHGSPASCGCIHHMWSLGLAILVRSFVNDVAAYLSRQTQRRSVFPYLVIPRLGFRL